MTEAASPSNAGPPNASPSNASPIEFYFDFGSPYAYLASAQIDALAARRGRAVTWRPILLGVVFKVTGMKANLHQPLRGDYLRRDAARCARQLNIPYTLPKSAPLHSVAAARAFYWAAAQDPALACTLAHALFRAHWAEGRDLAPAEAVAAVGPGVGINEARLLAGINEPAVKDRLRQETETAITKGVFGSPFFLVDGEPFWGADRLPMLEDWLARGGW